MACASPLPRRYSRSAIVDFVPGIIIMSASEISFLVGGVEKIHIGMTLEHVEVSEVGNMAQQHHCHVDFPFTCAMLFRGEGHGILFFHMYVRRERHHSQHGHAANILHHFYYCSPSVGQSRFRSLVISPSGLLPYKRISPNFHGQIPYRASPPSKLSPTGPHGLCASAE